MENCLRRDAAGNEVVRLAGRTSGIISSIVSRKCKSVERYHTCNDLNGEQQTISYVYSNFFDSKAK